MDDIATYVVMSVLPVCLIQNDQFVPTYTAFSLSYFSEDVKEVRRRYFRDAISGDDEGTGEICTHHLLNPFSTIWLTGSNKVVSTGHNQTIRCGSAKENNSPTH